MKRSSQISLYKLFIIFITGLSIMLASAGTAVSDEPGEKREPPPLKKMGVTIETKKRGHITANGKQYRVDKNTQIIDNTGVKLSLAALAVPCEAVIHYAPVVNQDARIQKIEVLEIAWGAKTGWSGAMPE